MLNFIIGRENIDLDPVHLDTDFYFGLQAKEAWFDDPFTKEVIKGIDRAEVYHGFTLKDKCGRGMSAEQLSRGTRTLLLIKFVPEYIYYASLLGDNCVPYLMQIVKEREESGKGDVTLLLEHYMEIPDEYEYLLKVDGVKSTIDDYEDKIATWCEHRDDPDYKWRD